MLSMLPACTTVVPPPVVIDNKCTPPDTYMKKAGDLPPITDTELTEPQVLSDWTNDIQSYNDLNVDNSLLIDWVTAHCQK